MDNVPCHPNCWSPSFKMNKLKSFIFFSVSMNIPSNEIIMKYLLTAMHCYMGVKDVFSHYQWFVIEAATLMNPLPWQRPRPPPRAITGRVTHRTIFKSFSAHSITVTKSYELSRLQYLDVFLLSSPRKRHDHRRPTCYFCQRLGSVTLSTSRSLSLHLGQQSQSGD